MGPAIQAIWYVEGSAICIHEVLLPDDVVVTHVITCQGRDHIVNVRSGCRNLVVVNVHLEPELTPEELNAIGYVSSLHIGLNILTPLA